MLHKTSILGGIERHTLSDGAATAHNFDDLEEAERAMRHHPFSTQEPTLESKAVDLSDMIYCGVVPCTDEDFPKIGVKLEARK